MSYALPARVQGAQEVQQMYETWAGISVCERLVCTDSHDGEDDAQSILTRKIRYPSYLLMSYGLGMGSSTTELKATHE